MAETLDLSLALSIIRSAMRARLQELGTCETSIEQVRRLLDEVGELAAALDVLHAAGSDPAQRELPITSITTRVAAGGASVELHEGAWKLQVDAAKRVDGIQPGAPTSSVPETGVLGKLLDMQKRLEVQADKIRLLTDSLTSVQATVTEAATQLHKQTLRIDGVQTVGTDMAERIGVLEAQVSGLASTAQENETRFRSFMDAQLAHADHLQHLTSTVANIGKVVHVRTPAGEEAQTVPHPMEVKQGRTEGNDWIPSITVVRDGYERELAPRFPVPARGQREIYVVALHGTDPGDAQMPEARIVHVASGNESKSVTALRTGMASLLGADRHIRALLNLREGA